MVGMLQGQCRIPNALAPEGREGGRYSSALRQGDGWVKSESWSPSRKCPLKPSKVLEIRTNSHRSRSFVRDTKTYIWLFDCSIRSTNDINRCRYMRIETHHHAKRRLMGQRRERCQVSGGMLRGSSRAEVREVPQEVRASVMLGCEHGSARCYCPSTLKNGQIRCPRNENEFLIIERSSREFYHLG